jgi:acetate kinase
VVAREEIGPSEVNALLNKHSGLLGLSGISNDMRVLLEAEGKGNDRAKMAVDVFCYRLKKYISAYVGILGGVDGLAFTGGIGENSDIIRARGLQGMEALGCLIDPSRNNGVQGVEAEISPAGARSRVFVIPTNEELLIARDTYSLVANRSPET